MKDIISISISIFALVLSIANTIYLIICNHKRINILLNTYTKSIINGKYIYIFDLLIENKSRLPIAINSVKIVNKNIEYDMNRNPKLISDITSKTGNMITGNYKLFSAKFPINISGLISDRKFLELSIVEDIDGECLFEFFTNRGIIKKEIDITEFYIEPTKFIKEYKDFVKYANE